MKNTPKPEECFSVLFFPSPDENKTRKCKKSIYKCPKTNKVPENQLKYWPTYMNNFIANNSASYVRRRFHPIRSDSFHSIRATNRRTRNKSYTGGCESCDEENEQEDEEKLEHDQTKSQSLIDENNTNEQQATNEQEEKDESYKMHFSFILS